LYRRTNRFGARGGERELGRTEGCGGEGGEPCLGCGFRRDDGHGWAACIFKKNHNREACARIQNRVADVARRRGIHLTGARSVTIRSELRRIRGRVSLSEGAAQVVHEPEDDLVTGLRTGMTATVEEQVDG
jgi:hypothetical protein